MKHTTSNGIAIFFLLFTVNVQSQIHFQSAYGTDFLEQGYSVVSSSDGTYVTASLTTSLGGADILLTKTSDDGQTIWSRGYGGDSGDFVHQAQETNDGGYIMTGWTTSYGAGDDDVLLIKTDSEGVVEWTKAYGRDDSDRGRSVRQTDDGGYIILGHTDGFGLSFNDIYLIKTDAVGDTSWVKIYGGVNATGENGWWIEQTSDGGYIATGNTSNGPGFTNLLLAKFDAAGDTTWTRSFGGEGGQCGGYCVKETVDGDFICTGWTNAFGAGDSDVYALKTDEDGNLLWSKSYGGPDEDGSQGIVQAADGAYVIAATTYNYGPIENSGANGYALGLAENGDTLWTKAFGGDLDEKIYAVEQGHVDGFVLAGWTRSMGAGSDDLFLVKANADGYICDAVGTSTEVGNPPTQVGTTGLGLVQIPDPTIITDIVFSIDNVMLLNDSVQCFGVLSGVDNKVNPDLVNLYPNPSSSNFTLDLSQIPEEVQISILNIEGKQVSSHSLQGAGKFTLQLSLPVGMYFLKYNSNNFQGVKRVVVVKD